MLCNFSSRLLVSRQRPLLLPVLMGANYSINFTWPQSSYPRAKSHDMGLILIYLINCWFFSMSYPFEFLMGEIYILIQEDSWIKVRKWMGVEWGFGHSSNHWLSFPLPRVSRLWKSGSVQIPNREERKFPHTWKPEKALDHTSGDQGSSPGFVLDELENLFPIDQCPTCPIYFKKIGEQDWRIAIIYKTKIVMSPVQRQEYWDI